MNPSGQHYPTMPNQQGFRQPVPNHPMMGPMQMQGHGTQMPGQPPNMQMQGPGMPMQNPGMPMQGQFNMQMQGQPNMQMTGPGLPNMQMSGSRQPNMQMQGPGQPHMQMQGPGQPNMQMQGPGQPNMQMQGPAQSNMQMQGPGQPNMQMQGPRQTNMQMQSPGQPNMQMQGPRQPNMQVQGPRQPNMQMQGPRQPNMQMQSPGQPNMQMQGNMGNQQNMGYPMQRGGPGMYNMIRPGVQPRQMMMPTPPTYTPDMAKEFTQRQQILQREQMKMMEKQKKKMEQEFKQRQFQETQKRLKEYSTIGGRKMDVDSAIHSIMGPQEVKGHGPKTHGPPMAQLHQEVLPPSQAPAEAPPTNNDDDFADFMSCPVAAASQSAVNPSTNKDAGNSGTANETAVNNESIVQPKKEEKKDLMSMMLECSDFSANKEAKSFKTKTAVKDVEPHHRVATYHQSDKSRQWSGETEKLSELFTLPEPETPTTTHPPTSSTTHPRSVAGTGVAQSPPRVAAGGVNTPQLGTSPPRPQKALPPWLTGESPVPDVYRMVFEACSKDNKIDTGMLYPILLRSSLPKEVLGHLWKLCNKQTPGQLRTPELYMLLAMICIAQNNMNITSLDILLQCPQAPVPNLGQDTAHPNPATNLPPPQGASHPPPQAGSHQSTVATAGSHPTQTAASQPVATVPQLPLPTVQADEDDFADFQGATIISSGIKQQEDDFGDFKSVPLPVQTGQQPVSTGLQPATTGIQPAVSGLKVVPPPLPRVGSDLIGDEDKYTAFRVALETSPTQKESEANMFGSSPQPLKSLSEETNFADFASFKDNSSSSDFQSFSSTPSSANQDFTISSQDSLSPNHRSDTSCSSWTNQSKDNKSGNESNNEDDFGDFADFKQATDFKQSATIPVSGNHPASIPVSGNHPVTMPTSGNHPATIPASGNHRATDKISAIKALVMDKKFYSEKPVEQKQEEKMKADDILNHPLGGASNVQTGSEKKADEDDWDPFVKSERVNTTNVISWNQPKTTEPADDGWADFSSAPSKTAGDDEFGSFQSKPPQESQIPHITQKHPAEERLKVDPKKAYSMFSQNKPPGLHHVGSGTGMSALDTEPPELPDFPDEEDDHDLHHVSGLDKFGTFQSQATYDLESSGNAGISSLVTPYGGFDDLEEEQRSANKKLPWNIGESNKESSGANQKQTYNATIPNSQSASSFEFTGWSNQSKAVLEDSQSMQSLDLQRPLGESEEGSPAGGDSQSVSSLDFAVTEKKVTSAPDQRSVGSLDLKQGTEPGGDLDGGPTGGVDAYSSGGGGGGMEESFGEFSTAPNIPEAAPTPRDVSEILTSVAPINMADRYTGLMDEPEDSDRHIYCWEKCLSECESVLRQANNILNTIDSLDVCKEVIDSSRGNQYIQGVTEIYRVASRIRLAMHGLTLSTDGLEDKQKEIHNQWNNLASFVASTSAMPSSQSLSFKKALVRTKEENINDRLCGVCLLDADIYSDSTSANENAGHKLSYGGRNYHAPCANFWVNCVDSTLPALKIPELL